MRSTLLEAARFFLVTLLGLVIDLGVGWASIAAGSGDLPAAAAGLFAGMVTNYLLHLRWTFRGHSRSPGLGHFARYGLTTLLTLAIRLGVLWTIAALGWQTMLHPLLRLCSGAGVSFVFSYAICRYVVFRPAVRHRG